MTDTIAAGPVEVVRAYCDAWMAGDTVAVLGLYHEDLTLHWSGRHRFAGDHVGRQASIEALLGLQAVTNRVPVEFVEVHEGSMSVAVVVCERWSRDGDSGDTEVLEHERCLNFTIQDGQVRSCRIYESAQREIDDWLASAGDEASVGHRELLSTCSAGWAARDVDAIVACHNDDTTFENHGRTGVACGRDAVADAFRSLWKDHPDLSTTPLRATFGADHAVVEYEIATTVDGVAMGAPAVDLFRFRDGLIESKDTWVSELRRL